MTVTSATLDRIWQHEAEFRVVVFGIIPRRTSNGEITLLIVKEADAAEVIMVLTYSASSGRCVGCCVLLLSLPEEILAQRLRYLVLQHVAVG